MQEEPRDMPREELHCFRFYVIPNRAITQERK